MLAKVSERQMHRVRAALTFGWLLLTASLFYDPISIHLTDPSSTWSPLHLDPSVCVRVQGVCLQEEPFYIGAPFFWGLVVPSSLFVLLVLGHEFWRRICPLSFLSQIPRALGIERKRKREDKKTGKIRYEVAKVPPDSWLARNHLYFQLGLFFAGISARILFVNSDRRSLGIFFLLTMVSAIAVGFWYGGKSWCHYFCPMAPVQQVYAEPRGLLNSVAHQGERQGVTQSMCRTVSHDGKELSACVACNSPCLDIDAERHYWNGIKEPQQQVLRYGYVGLAVGYFLYYYLYSGTFEYYFSGAWAHEASQIALLGKPGFYIFGQAIPIPKFAAAPLTIAVFGVAFYFLGRFLENRYLAFQRRRHGAFSRELARHHMFAIFTFFVFNYFYIFAGRNFVRLLPTPIRFAVPVALGICSALWLYQTWQRKPDLYYREGIASRLRAQLKKLELDLERFLEGRILDDLSADEVYVLAKTLPDFSKDQRLIAYKGLLREAIEEGFVIDGSQGYQRFERLRQELSVTDAEHEGILVQLTQESPEIFDPNRQHSRENLLRIESYRESLIEKILEAWEDRPESARIVDFLRAFNPNDDRSDPEADAALDDLIAALPEKDRRAVRGIRQEYAISDQDERDALHLSAPGELWQQLANKFDLLAAFDPHDSGSLHSVFEQIDRNASGDITPSELKEFTGNIGVSLDDVRVSEMLDWADTTGDRRISYDEFCEIFAYLQKRRQEVGNAPTEIRPAQPAPAAGNAPTEIRPAREASSDATDRDDRPTQP